MNQTPAQTLTDMVAALKGELVVPPPNLEPPAFNPMGESLGIQELANWQPDPASYVRTSSWLDPFLKKPKTYEEATRDLDSGYHRDTQAQADERRGR